MARRARMDLLVTTVGEIARQAPQAQPMFAADGVPLGVNDVVTLRVIDGYPLEWYPGPDPRGAEPGYRAIDLVALAFGPAPRACEAFEGERRLAEAGW